MTHPTFPLLSALAMLSPQPASPTATRRIVRLSTMNSSMAQTAQTALTSQPGSGPAATTPTIRKMKGFKPREPLRIDPPVRQATMITPEQAQHRRALEECQRTQGRWYARVQGKNLWAGGTDVDEIYGGIWVSSNAVEPGDFSNSRTRRNFGLQYIWGNNENVNLGRYPTRDLSTITLDGQHNWRGPDVEVSIHFDLRDEDDGRGGSNDEFFLLPGRKIKKGYANYQEFVFTLPTCTEAPEFEHATQIILTGRDGGAGRNYVSLLVNVRFFRRYP